MILVVWLEKYNVYGIIFKIKNYKVKEISNCSQSGWKFIDGAEFIQWKVDDNISYTYKIHFA